LFSFAVGLASLLLGGGKQLPWGFVIARMIHWWIAEWLD